MPRYTVTDPQTNKSVDLEGDSPPTEQELNEIFSTVHGNSPSENSGQINPPSFMSQAKSAIDTYSNTQLGSPQDLLGRLDSGIRQGFGKLGQYAAENLVQPEMRRFGNQTYNSGGMNPKLAAGIGTFISMAPDIVSLAGPEQSIEQPKPLFRSVSGPMAARQMGLTKMFQKTPFARGKVAEAANVALENNIIPISGNPKIAMDRALDLQKQSGEALGAMRESVGATPIDSVFDSLESARQRATNGLRGGAWDAVHRKFDEAQETLLALLNNNGAVPIKDVERAKKLLGNTVNWVADNVSQESAKQISSAIESGVENIMRSKGLDMGAYQAQKRLFGASKTMQKGLSNEIASQAGNNAISLPTMVAGAGQLATGNVPGAVAALGVVEGLKRRGAGIGARGLEFLSRRITPELATSAPFDVLGPGVANLAGRRILATTNPEPIFKSGKQLKGFGKNPNGSMEGISERGQEQMSEPTDNGDKQQYQNNNYGNFESLNNHVLTEPLAREYLKKANGDKAKARQMAKRDGYKIP